MSDPVTEAQARLSMSIMRVQSDIRDRLVAETNMCADALDAIVDMLGDAPELPDVRAVIAQAVIDANTRAPKLFVCGICFHRIDGPMIAQAAQPTPRLVHYPSCPTDQDRIFDASEELLRSEPGGLD